MFMTAVDSVTAFWDEVWNAHDPEAVDRFVADDVRVVAGGNEISGKEHLKTWIGGFLEKIDDLHVDALETFQSQDGTRVTSRWVLTGSNNGILDTERDGQPIAMTGTAIWAFGEDEKMVRGWIELASWEQYQRLLKT